MEKFFDIIFLDETFEFLSNLERKHSEKILFNMRKAQRFQDPELFKKLNEEIWEFRTIYQKTHYRLFAFWDKINTENILVVSTHGVVKKTNKTLEKEILKARQIRTQYFKDKETHNMKKK
jgi:phage-related protein